MAFETLYPLTSQANLRKRYAELTTSAPEIIFAHAVQKLQLAVASVYDDTTCEHVHAYRFGLLEEVAFCINHIAKISKPRDLLMHSPHSSTPLSLVHNTLKLTVTGDGLLSLENLGGEFFVADDGVDAFWIPEISFELIA